MRRVGLIMEDLRSWRTFYRQKADETEVLFVKDRLHERAAACDDAWHHLSDAAETLRFFS